MDVMYYDDSTKKLNGDINSFVWDTQNGGKISLLEFILRKRQK